MVPADSRRIPRVPRYSGLHYASFRFEYGVVTLCDRTFQTVLLTKFLAMSWSYNPNNAVTLLVWAIPRSLATTGGIIVIFFSCIHGSRVICTSPWLIAAYHVLHRLREPRHPPCALAYFHYHVHTPFLKQSGWYILLALLVLTKSLFFSLLHHVKDLYKILWRILWDWLASQVYPYFLWRITDSNRWPPACKAGALASWANPPCCSFSKAGAKVSVLFWTRK